MSTYRCSLNDEIHDALGDFLTVLLEEDSSLMNASVSDRFRGAKARMMAIDADDTV